MPAPSKYNPKIVAVILQVIRVGGTISEAAAAANISRDILHVWTHGGMKNGKPLLPKDGLFDAIEKAKEERVVAWLGRIEAAINKGQWQAAAWKLERLYPQRFGRQRFEITGADGKPFLDAFALEPLSAAAAELVDAHLEAALRGRTHANGASGS